MIQALWRVSSVRSVVVFAFATLLSACGGEVDLVFVGADDGSGGDSGGGGKSGGGGSSGAGDPSCGDRVVNGDEECDDGDRADGDGCSGDCTVEEGWTCEGAPSSCIKCGNGSVEADEQCDDGNNDDDDGCSAECAIEGSCAAPTVIELSPSEGDLVGSVNSTTGSEESSQVETAECGGSMSGAGADRIFEFELPAAADLEVKVGANFDAIVRILSSPCDLNDELPGTCVDDAAVAQVETLRIDSAPPGTYYVVVDGKTSQQAGAFSVDVSARCPLSGLKIERVVLAEPFRTSIFNSNQSCAIDLSRVGVFSEPEAADAPKTLPAFSLEPLKRRLLTSEMPPPNGTTYQGNIRYDLEDYAGAFYLCRGECEATSGANVIDAFRWEGTSGALSTDPPPAVSFDADADALTDRANMSYYRTRRMGEFPDFLATDWVGAYFVETFEDGVLSGWDPPTALFYDANFEHVTGTLGQFSLALVGGNPAPAVWNGPKVRFRDNAGALKALQPSYVSLMVRGSDKTLSHGWTFFGNAGPTGAEASGFGSLFRENGTVGFGTGTIAFTLPYDVETWYLVEYHDFFWGGGAGTVQVSVDGRLRGTINIGAASVGQLSLRSIGDTTVWVDQIIVR